jgi:hypothetical protein
VAETRVVTPRGDLFVVRLGERPAQKVLTAKEKTSAFIAKIARVANKPGASRQSIFRSSTGKKVYAYSVYPKDPTKIVREDVTGKMAVGRLVKGRFRALSQNSV